MEINTYVIQLAEVKPDGSEELHKCEAIKAYTHIGAANAAAKMYPDLKVIRISREWVPIANCHNCGGIICKGDYGGTLVRNKGGKNYCLECLS